MGSGSGSQSQSSSSCSNGHCISTSVKNGKLYVNGEVVAEVPHGTATNVQTRDGQVFLNGRKVWPRTAAAPAPAPAPATPAAKAPATATPGKGPAKECKKAAFDQCGGKDFKGDTCCPSGHCCKATNEYYSKCGAC